MRIHGEAIRFGVHCGPENTGFEDYRDLWVRCEELGYEWVSDFDHFLPIFGDPAGRQFEGTAMLAAMAAHTSRVRCGMLVLGVTYRHPAVVANIAATIDHISGGRAEFGIGAAWFEKEHRQYGIPFPRLGVRMDMLDEACRVMRGLWTEERFSFAGDHFRLEDAQMDPKPLQARLPLMIGGEGEKRTLRIVAEFADEWNATRIDVPGFRAKRAVLAAHCAAFSRDPETIGRSLMIPLAIGRDSTDVARRIAAARASFPSLPPDEAAWRAAGFLAGPAESVIAALAEWKAAGMQRILLQMLDQEDIAALELFARTVLPALR